MDFDTNDPPPGTCGIYKIYSACNDTSYIGHSGDILKRWNDHRSALKRRDKKKCNPHLLNAWVKYGEDAFEFYVIDKCPVALLHIREQLHLNLHPNNYNIRPAAESNLGFRHSSETKAKMSDSRMGNTNTLGHKHTDETIAKMTGRKAPPEERAKISASLIGNNRRLGCKDSEEIRAKKSGAQKARRERERAERAASDGAMTAASAV